MALVASAACAGGSPVVSGVAPGTFVARDLIDVGSPGSIPAIVTPRFESPVAAAAWLPPASPVIAYVEGATARAYPISILMRHEVVHDTVAGRPIAVTYFPLADAGAVWDRRAGARALTLRASGKVYRADSVLYDVETESLWPQLTGEAVAGPMKGTRLRMLPSLLATFAQFREAYPDGDVLARPRPAVDYDRNPYAGYGRRRAPPRDMFLARLDARRPAMRQVAATFGAGGRPFAYDVESASFEVGTGPRFLTAIANAAVPSPLDARTISGGASAGSANWFERPASMSMARAHDGTIVDAETHSTWSPLGRAVAGPLRGKTLTPVPQAHALWFAWAALSPETALL